MWRAVALSSLLLSLVKAVDAIDAHNRVSFLIWGVLFIIWCVAIIFVDE
jgi:hypothetical protein